MTFLLNVLGALNLTGAVFNLVMLARFDGGIVNAAALVLNALVFADWVGNRP